MTRQKRERDQAYWRALNEIVDDIFVAAKRRGLSHRQVTRAAGVGSGTVSRLWTRTTEYPWLRTVWRLARAVGLELRLRALPMKKAG